MEHICYSCGEGFGVPKFLTETGEAVSKGFSSEIAVCPYCESDNWDVDD